MDKPWEKYSTKNQSGMKPWEMYSTHSQPEMKPWEKFASVSQQPAWYQKLGQAADDIVRLGANGLTFGFADQLAGALNGDGAEKERQLSEQAAKRAGSAGVAAEIGGGLLSGLGAEKAGLTLAGRAGPAAISGLKGIAARLGLSAAEGAGYGALSSAGHGTDIKSGAALGAVLGAAAPVASYGANYGANKAINAGDGIIKSLLGKGRLEGPISDLSKKSQKFIKNNLLNEEAIASYKPNINDLGRDAVLADVSPDWLGVARGAAAHPGARGIVELPLKNRADAGNDRIRSAVNNYLGDAIIPSEVNASIDKDKRRVGSLYNDAIENTGPIDTSGLDKSLKEQELVTRGPEQDAIKAVRRFLKKPESFKSKSRVGGAAANNLKLATSLKSTRRVGGSAANNLNLDTSLESMRRIGGSPANKRELDTNPKSILSTRQAIDDLINYDNNKNMSPMAIHALTSARSEIDNLIRKANPDIKNIDSAFSELANQQEALGMGSSVLNNGKTALRPQELNDILAKSPHKDFIRQGARAELDRAIGTHANDAAALKRVVQGEGDWNRDKLRALFGKDNADKALKSIDRESLFQNTKNRVTSGSDTAMANKFGEYLGDSVNPSDIPVDSNLVSFSTRVLRNLLGSAIGNKSSEKSSLVAQELGRLSVTSGPERDKIISNLSDLAAGAAKDKASKAAREQIIRALVRAGAKSSQNYENKGGN